MDDQQMALFDEEDPVPNLYPGAFLTRDEATPLLTSVEIDGLKGFDRVGELTSNPLRFLLARIIPGNLRFSRPLRLLLSVFAVVSISTIGI